MAVRLHGPLSVRFTVGTLLAIAGVALAPQSAGAGALADVVGGIVKAAGKGSSGGSGGGGGAGGDIVEGVFRGVAESLWAPRHPNVDVVLGSGPVAPPPPAPDTEFRLYLGAQSVADSDGAFSLEAAAAYADFGLTVRYSSFFEAQPATDSFLRLDVWNVVGGWRIAGDGPVAAWIEGGLAGLATVAQVSQFGVIAGLRLERRLGGALAAAAEGRRLFLEDGVRAIDLRAALRLSILQLSYRWLDFDVGPPLRGPEIGLAFSF